MKPKFNSLSISNSLEKNCKCIFRFKTCLALKIQINIIYDRLGGNCSMSKKVIASYYLHNSL